jgi:hypothetical protein
MQQFQDLSQPQNQDLHLIILDCEEEKVDFPMQFMV